VNCSYLTINPLYTTLILGPSIVLPTKARPALAVYTFYRIRGSNGSAY
jgi:hypothetical protein